MSDVLSLRDAAWAVQYIGRSALFLLYIGELKPRFGQKWPAAAAFLALAGVSMGIQYTANIRLLYDNAVNILCWAAVCLCLQKTDWRNAVYGALSYAVIGDLAKILAHDLLLDWLLLRFPGGSPAAWNWAYTALYLACMVGMTLLCRRWIFASDKARFSPAQLALIYLPSAVYFYARNFQFDLLDLAAKNSEYLVKAYTLLLLLGVSDLMISILADNNLSTKMQQEELRHMEALIHKQHQEFLSQQAASAAVHQKYHDLKNCLIGLKAEGGAESRVRRRMIAELEQVMQPLETEIKTGNEFLDIILAEKIQICQKKGIRLTPYADGSSLNFVEGLDLCVIVGNALDNAIEAVERLPAEEREIHLRLTGSHGMALFSVQNFHREALRRDARGHFKTSKTDAENHGYGLHGIAQVVEQYDGTVTVDATDREFVLNILLPVPPQETQAGQ